MRFLFTLLLITTFSISFGQTIIEKEINSSEFNDIRKLKIFLPKGYNNDTIKKHPVAIILDNDFLFDVYVGNSKIFSDSDIAPKQIIIGLETDSNTNKDVSVIKENGNLSTNATKFYNHIKNEVIPYTKENFTTSPFLSIIGHEEAGNFVTHFLKETTPIFNSYIAISPTFNENSPQLFTSYNLKRFNDIDNKFFLFISNENKNTENEKNMISSLTEEIKKLEIENFYISHKEFKNSPNSPTSINVAVPYAFSHIFKLYAGITKEEYNEKVKDLSPLNAIDFVRNKYLDIESYYGTNLNVRIQDILAIENIVMDQQDGDYLRDLGEFASVKHPNSPLGDFYTGMFHELGKDYERALSYYKFGYGKMDPSDPNTDAYYKNIERVQMLGNLDTNEELLPLQEEQLLDEEPQLEEENNNGDDE